MKDKGAEINRDHDRDLDRDRIKKSLSPRRNERQAEPRS